MRGGLFCGLVAAALLAHSMSAHASGIQMLPPSDFFGNACSGETGGLLEWDGQTSLKCVPGASGDSSGNLAIGGTIRPGSDGIRTGGACPTEGAIGYDTVSATHQPVYCNGTLQWTAMSSGLTAAGNTSSWGDLNGCYGGNVGGSQLYVDRNTVYLDWASVYNCVYYNESDMRLKRAIRALPDEAGLSAIMKLRPVTFHWKEADRDEREGEQAGFLAQDVEKIFPDMVQIGDRPTTIRTAQGEETVANPKSLKYQMLFAPLVKAIQELKAESDDQTARLEALEAEFDAYKRVHP